MQRLRTVTSLGVSAVAGHHAVPAALLLYFVDVLVDNNRCCFRRSFRNLLTNEAIIKEPDFLGALNHVAL